MEKKEKDIVKIAAEAGAKAAMERLETERARQDETRRDKRLHNTRLLLRNYRELKSYIDLAIYRVEQDDEEDAIDLLDLALNRAVSGELQIDSIKRSVRRTATIMRHIDNMIALYSAYCSQSLKPEEKRHYRVVRALYIDFPPLSVYEIAEREGIAERTVYKDVDAAIEKLSALIFGIEGIWKEGPEITGQKVGSDRAIRL